MYFLQETAAILVFGLCKANFVADFCKRFEEQVPFSVNFFKQNARGKSAILQMTKK
jgi:hypothetical protein